MLAFNPKKNFSTVEDNDEEPPHKKHKNYSADVSRQGKKSRLQIPKPTDENAINSASTVKKSILSKKRKPAEQQDFKAPVATAESSEERQMRLLEEVEREKGEEEAEELDEHKIKKLIFSFEKKSQKNQEMRIKHVDNPGKFMDSEIELNQAILDMKAIATVPHHYHFIVELNAVKTLLNLLSHQNSDIASAVVDLLQELTDNDEHLDADADEEDREGIMMLIDALLSSKLCTLFIQNLDRYDEGNAEDAAGVHNTFAVIENVLESTPDAYKNFTGEGLLSWIFKRLKSKIPFNANKLYVSEVLSILLQNDDEKLKKQVGEMDGIDAILGQLAAFKRHDPSNLEEVEFMENMFNCLCACLLFSSNKERFLQGEGMQLMNLMLREKKISRNSALKVMDYAMQGPEGASNCAKFVEIYGLRTLFPLFMRPPKKNKKIGSTVKDHEEHIVSIMANMLQNLKGSSKARVLAKFQENDHEKLERLMDLYVKYSRRVKAVEEDLERNRERLLELNGDDEERLEEDNYIKRLDCGLFTLQHLAYVMVDVGHSAGGGAKERVVRLLSVKGESVKGVRRVMREFMRQYDDTNSAQANVHKQKIIALVEKF